MKEEKINVFEHEFTLMLQGYVVTVTKFNEDVVTLTQIYQSGIKYQTPLNVKLKYGKTADEFVGEFELQNAKLQSQTDFSLDESENFSYTKGDLRKNENN